MRTFEKRRSGRKGREKASWTIPAAKLSKHVPRRGKPGIDHTRSGEASLRPTEAV
ncbi:hypothetical protein HMPREF0762_00088 [Slackia exigua ATCC 700122]|uniref:Uncharacterized protein n=1 Tax=Slackia exigua (strain ATCC 700122 / DSM 15923 / CIP 105133 / JCM 11022 / KCTC 5966 / S-7) TaxID=649764 RepID=D0WE63_SLAES|nr:hypothetical protein HMPREF0762_00088 [Slackia exigua ATCC 700122]